MKPQQKNLKPKLFEGLRSGDLKDMVSPIMSIDRYKSKMGDDKDVVVLAFKTKEKMPAIDLMEFIEKGYQFVLDADMSTGEEKDGQYSVFVELERSVSAPKQIIELLSGVGQASGCEDWQFHYYKDSEIRDCTEQALEDHIPVTPEEYETRMQELKQDDVTSFFNQGATDSADLDTDDNITVTKPYAESLNMKLLAMGNYQEIKESIPGGIQLDPLSQYQTNYLEKYLGNYEIHKIQDKFLIKNGDRAIIVQKARW